MRLSFKREFTYISILILALTGLIVAGGQGLPAPLAIFRVVFALIFLLFIPGYTLQVAIFPGGEDLVGPERLALSIALSFALIPVLALILDALPWGIDLRPIVLAETLCVILFSAVAIFRRSRLDADGLDRQGLRTKLKNWWSEETKSNRRLLVVLSAVFVIVALTMVVIALLPNPGEQFTEFYILGPDGLAEKFPFQAQVGQPLQVTMGVHNLERVPETYRAEIWVQDTWSERRQQVGALPAFSLGRDETLEFPVTWQMPWAGDDMQVELLLFEGEGSEPYRRLRLYLDVMPTERGF